MGLMVQGLLVINISIQLLPSAFGLPLAYSPLLHGFPRSVIRVASSFPASPGRSGSPF